MAIVATSEKRVRPEVKASASLQILAYQVCLQLLGGLSCIYLIVCWSDLDQEHQGRSERDDHKFLSRK